ncbi:translation initiation factor 2 [Paenibacillus sp. N4]|uniref:translation initiation factor 2 n=1 Tax=Paenibacillus vietnamensis TaxID=2590547 RepID=UPI001CD171AB|nr:translation initiation factor 2 [Paenibacillus vietnamensis]MCA0756876.1 translation initiation factor 2 [Paenibacillus vietnamensis]
MENNKELRDIEIAKLAFIGASIAAIGDGIGALAAGLALDALRQDHQIQNDNRNASFAGPTQVQLDYYIKELIRIRNIVG